MSSMEGWNNIDSMFNVLIDDRFPIYSMFNITLRCMVRVCLVAPFRMGFRKVMLHIKKVLSQNKGIDLNGNVYGFRQVSGYLFSEPVSF